MRQISLFILLGSLFILLPIHVRAVASGDMSAEEIVQECERKTGFKATDRAARAFIFRRCVQTIQTESKHETLAETKELHRKNLQIKAQTTFDSRGTGDRTLMKRSRPPRSQGIQRVYQDQTQFQSVQFNRGRAPDAPLSPKEEKIKRAQVDTSLGRYERKKLSEECSTLSGFRQELCMRSKLTEGSPRRWTKESRQKK